MHLSEASRVDAPRRFPEATVGGDDCAKTPRQPLSGHRDVSAETCAVASPNEVPIWPAALLTSEIRAPPNEHPKKIRPRAPPNPAVRCEAYVPRPPLGRIQCWGV